MITNKDNKEIMKIIKKNITKKKRKEKRGRPKKYNEEDIIFLLILKRIEGLSYRQLEKRAKDFFKDYPDYTTIQKREKQINEREIDKISQKVLEVIGKKDKK